MDVFVAVRILSSHIARTSSGYAPKRSRSASSGDFVKLNWKTSMKALSFASVRNASEPTGGHN